MFHAALALQYGEGACLYTQEGSVAALFSEYAEIFKGMPLARRLPHDIEVVREAGFAYRELPKWLDKENRLLVGYFQSERYFGDKDRVRKFFAPSEDRIRLLRTRFGDWLDRPQVTGISVRHGEDYRKVSFILPFCGKQYYRDCIAKLPKAKDFIVCSDDYAWCKKFFLKEFPEKHFLFMEGEAVLDQLYIHTLCQNVILSNSSFSWWGGWLNQQPNRRILMPSMWLGYRHFGKTDWSSIYFGGAEIVKNRYTLGAWVYAHLIYWWTHVKIRFYPLRKKIFWLFCKIGYKRVSASNE